MKMTLKLLFVALLASWALARPHVARADGTYYQCDAQWTQDYSQLEQWMGQCMSCTHEGMPNYQVCYTIPEALTEQQCQNGQCQEYTYGTSDYTTCNQINESAQQCVSSCVYEFTQAYNQDFTADCPPVS